MIKKLHKKVFLPAFIAGSVLISSAQTGLNFDGTDDYVQTDYAGVLGAANRTFEAWIYVPSPVPSSSFAILDYGTNDVGSRNTFLVKNDNSLKFVSGGTNANMGTDPDTVPLDVWTHVAFVLNNGTGYLYINGVEKATANLTTVNTPSGNENVLIGNRVSGPNTMFFGGSMDEVRIWNVARTQIEISDSMNAEFCELPEGLVAYYKLNEGAAGEDNTSITNVVDEVNSSSVNTMEGFVLSGTDSNYVSGNVDSDIDATVSVDGSGLTANQADATYQWVDADNANAAIDGATSQSFIPSETGNYAVEITLGACSVMSDAASFVAEPAFNKRTGLHFDGVDDYVQGTTIPVAGNGARTVEAWVRTTKDSQPASAGGDGQSVICDWGYSSSGQRFTFNLLWSNGIRLETAAGGVSGTTPVNDGAWHHVAAVYNPSASPTVKVYVDGTEDASGNPTVNTSSSSWATKIRLGKRVDGSGPFEGDMDEVRVWNVALTEAQIQSRMNVELCGDETGLVIYYPFGEGTPGEDNTGIATLTDMSATGDDATLNNFTLSGAESNWVEGHGLLSLEGTTLTAAQTNLETTPTEVVATYQWVDCDNGNAVIDGATEQAFTPEASGNYAVEITVDGCVTTSGCMAVDVNALGIEESLMDTLKVFPNPTSGNLNVVLNGVYQTVDAQLVSITGKVVGKYQFSNSNGFDLNLSNFNSGLYFLKLKADNMDAVTVKVIKM
ncbi:LamG-like jellyroll fold domain-containing protein [Mangrovimonas xylaniphaga]|uniref:LamG-like jellyroll fold domain-containing protein n=1 Tax=Mangrovimonas xylaniphaga TaxID=1645915 RepID=UPI0006B4C485|nr:LamG-like jellyroll fold domain-containing protein [Mangrovimonas xylaniphaga]